MPPVSSPRLLVGLGSRFAQDVSRNKNGHVVGIDDAAGDGPGKQRAKRTVPHGKRRGHVGDDQAATFLRGHRRRQRVRDHHITIGLALGQFTGFQKLRGRGARQFPEMGGREVRNVTEPRPGRAISTRYARQYGSPSLWSQSGRMDALLPAH